MKNIKKLTLLHSNDLHGDFLAENIDADLVGGVSLLSGYVNKVRSEEQNVIYAIAGDMFRGSVIDSEYRGMSTIEIMNALAPDIVTIGNHEIDYGIAHLLFIEKCANFPIINSNLYIKTNGKRLFDPYRIIEIDGMKILFIGIITEEILSSAKNDKLIGSVIDTEAAAAEVGKICNAHNSIDIDFTVLLTHIGFEEDKRLAELLDPDWGVDVIIGGHSHTFIKEPAIVNGIPIVQAGTGTDGIGRFDIDIDTDTNSIDKFTWKFIPINDKTCPKDEQLEKLITGFKSVTDQKYERVVTKFKKELTHPERTQETELGDLICDILQDGTGVDVMLLGSGSVRSYKMGPIVTFGSLTECFPYAGKIYMVKVTGDMLRHMLLYIMRDEAWVGHTEFYQFPKQLRMIYSKSRHDFIKCEYDGDEITGDRLFTVGLQEYHFNNFQQFLDVDLNEVSKIMKPRVVSTSDFDIINEYMSSHNILDAEVEGRLVVID